MKKQALYSCAVSAGLVVMVAVVFGQTCRFDFVNYDDDLYVTGNREVQQGLTRENVAWAFTSSDVANWHPLTWLSYLLDIQLFGKNAGMMHLVNVFWHALNTVLLFLILKRLTGAFWPSALVAALFGVHPSHVESVAWISERKDVLSTFFLLATIAAYLAYVERGGIVRYLMVTLGLALGLMAKPMLVTLPALLLLLDYWPLGRFNVGVSQTKAPGAPSKGKAKKKGKAKQRNAPEPRLGVPGGEFPMFFELPPDRVLRCALEKMPWFALAIATSIVTVVVQHEALKPIALRFRIGNAIVAYVRYILHTVWPRDLALIYPHLGAGLPLWQVAGALVLLVAISGVAVWRMRRSPYFIVGWLWYLGTLVPVIGVIQVGIQAMADRYSYVPLIGLFIIIAWGGRDLAARSRIPRQALAAAATIVVIALLVCAFLQTRYWENSFTLFEHTLAVTKDNYQAHSNMGDAYRLSGQYEQAIGHYETALRIQPAHRSALLNIGIAYAMMHKPAEAAAYFEKALALNPNAADVHNNLGNTYVERNQLDEAVRCYRRALQIDPNNEDGHANLGFALSQQGNIEEAAREYREALRVNPAHPNVSEALRQLEAQIAQRPAGGNAPPEGKVNE